VNLSLGDLVVHSCLPRPRKTPVLNLLPFLVAAVIGPAGPQAPPFRVHDLAALTDAEARQFVGWRALFRVALDGEPDGDPQGGWRYDCRGEGGPLRTLWLPDGDDLVAVGAEQGSGVLRVEATLLRIVHPPVTGADGSRLPGLVEYQLVGGRVVDRPER
jgi:hypothetical protein